MNFKLLYLPAKLKSLIIALQTAHRTEVTTLSFPKPWLSCFPLVFMPLPTTPSSSPKLGTLAPPPARTFWKCVTCSFFCFSSSSFPFTFHHCPNSEAPSSLSSDTSQSSLWRHPCQSCPHSGIPRILQKSILHSEAEAWLFHFAASGCSGALPTPQGKGWTPWVGNDDPCPDFGLLALYPSNS